MVLDKSVTEKSNSTIREEQIKRRDYHLANWQTSGQGMSEYCRNNGVSTSTLSTWNRKSKISKPVVKTKKSNFKQVQLTNPVFDSHPELMVNVRGNMKLYFKTISNVSLISSLLKELG